MDDHINAGPGYDDVSVRIESCTIDEVGAAGRAPGIAGIEFQPFMSLLSDPHADAAIRIDDCCWLDGPIDPRITLRWIPLEEGNPPAGTQTIEVHFSRWTRPRVKKGLRVRARRRSRREEAPPSDPTQTET